MIKMMAIKQFLLCLKEFKAVGDEPFELDDHIL